MANRRAVRLIEQITGGDVERDGGFGSGKLRLLLQAGKLCPAIGKIRVVNRCGHRENQKVDMLGTTHLLT